MVSAYSTCLGLSTWSLFSASIRERMSMELSGVRSSWLMLARNSDLYFEVSASCSAFSSMAFRVCSISRFFRSTSAFCTASWRAFSSSSTFVCWSSSCCWRSRSSLSRRLRACSSSRLFVCWSSSCWLCSSCVRPWLCASSASVRMFASMELRTMPMDSVSWSRNVRWFVLNRWNEANSMTALTSPSKSTGSTTMLRGGALPRPELTWM